MINELVIQKDRIGWDNLTDPLKAEGRNNGVNKLKFKKVFDDFAKNAKQFPDRFKTWAGKVLDLVKEKWREEGGFIRIGAEKPKVKEKKTKATRGPPERAPAGLGLSIEAKAIEAGLVRGFGGDIVDFKPSTFPEQAKLMERLQQDMDNTMNVVRGIAPLPTGLNGATVIKTLENYAMANGDGAMMQELARSPLTGETSLAGQMLSFARERDPFSPVAQNERGC